MPGFPWVRHSTTRKFPWIDILMFLLSLPPRWTVLRDLSLLAHLSCDCRISRAGCIGIASRGNGLAGLVGSTRTPGLGVYR